MASAAQEFATSASRAAARGTAGTDCEKEPIHTPGAVQAHGALLVAKEATLEVRSASANLSGFLGITPDAALGRSLPELLGLDPAALRAAAAWPGAEPVVLAERALLATIHGASGHVFVELEPWHPDERSVTEVAATVMALRNAKQQGRLFEGAVAAFRRLTGFDRAMLYRFAEDGHGEVVAEDLAPGQLPYLGLHYPASDIPSQARRLYLVQRVRSIPDASYVPVALLSADADGMPLDMSGCALRSVSPVHLEYMRNMGTAASLTVSVVVDGALWGLLVCHHRVPRHAGPKLRGLCDLLGQTLSAMVAAKEQAARAAQLAARQRRLDALMSALSDPGGGDCLDRLMSVEADVLGLLGADGAVVSLGGRAVELGDAPGPALTTRLRALLLARGPDAQAADDIGLEEAAGGFGGAMFLPLVGRPGDGVLAVRREVTGTVAWGGDPRKPLPDAAGRISPRKSFATWVEQVRGRSAPWSAADFVAARELRQLLDLAQARRAEAALTGKADFDAVTGLPSRDALEGAVRSSAAEVGGCAVLAVCVDRLAAVNATQGYSAGDALLREAAGRVAAVAAELGATAVRAGGNRFALALAAAAPADALAAGEGVRAAFAAPFVLPGGALYATASVGVAHGRGDEAQAGRLLAAADDAARSAKEEGGNRAVLRPLASCAEAARRLAVEQALRAALRSGGAGLSLAFQPLYAATATSDGPLGFEALIRWSHPELGRVTPTEFVPVADATDLGSALGDWVLAAALREARRWAALYPERPFRIAVNISPRQLSRAELAPSVLDLLARHGVPPARLCIEVTEGALADAAAASTLERLRAAGVRVAVDDFGTGYSCLSYLCRLPADDVKLDRSLLHGAASGGAQSGDFLAAVVALARSAGLGIVAEGVETPEQLAAVAAAGADAVQGFLLGRPVSADEAGLLLVMPPPNRLRSTLPVSFRDIVEGANDVVIVTDANLDPPGPRIVYANPAFTRLTGYELADVLGRSPRLLQGPGTDAETMHEIGARLREGRDFHGKILNYARNGMPYWLDLRIFPLRNAHGAITHFAAVERDVTNDKRRLDELEELAERDTLTGIANRRRLVRHADGQLAAAHAGRASAAAGECFAYLDIDWFKRVNDTHGHATGDAVLSGIADLLAENVRRADLVARLGGEEFGIWMSGIPLAEARYVAERLRRTVAATAIPTPVGPVAVTCSIGLAMVEPGQGAVESVMRRADEALYRAKRGGRNRVEVSE